MPEFISFNLRKSVGVTYGKITDFAENPLQMMRSLSEKHGDAAALDDDGQRVHFVFGPDYVKQVLSNSESFHSQFFAIRGPKKSAQRRLTSGLLAMNGPPHKEQRRMVMGPFQKRAIAAYHDSVTSQATRFLDQWQIGETIDLAEEMTEYMLQQTSSLMFGLDLPELVLPMGKLTEKWVWLNHLAGPSAFSSEDRDLAIYDQLLAVANELEDSIRKLIQIRRSTHLGGDVLSLLLRAHEAGETVTDEQLIGHVALLFAAAHLTSSHTLTWTMLLLAQHPEVMHKLHQELQQNVSGPTLSPEELGTLPYLDHVLKESMRILPASCYSQRVASEPVDLGPFQLEKGSIVIFSQVITHHLDSLYENPRQFLPERWETLTPSPYAYFPFGAGPRMCIGAMLGRMQLEISLVAILKRFKLSVPHRSEIQANVRSTMLFPDSTVPVLLEEHDGKFEASSIRGSIKELVDFPKLVNPVGVRSA